MTTANKHGDDNNQGEHAYRLANGRQYVCSKSGCHEVDPKRMNDEVLRLNARYNLGKPSK